MKWNWIIRVYLFMYFQSYGRTIFAIFVLKLILPIMTEHVICFKMWDVHCSLSDVKSRLQFITTVQCLYRIGHNSAFGNTSLNPTNEITSLNPCISTTATDRLISIEDMSKSKLHYDRQSVGQSVLVSGAHLGPVTNLSFILKIYWDSCGNVIF
jgi:hypothetical protein